MSEVVFLAKPQYNELNQRLIHIEEMVAELLGGAKAPKRDIPAAHTPDEPEPTLPENDVKSSVTPGSPGEKLAKMQEALKGEKKK